MSYYYISNNLMYDYYLIFISVDRTFASPIVKEDPEIMI